MVRDVRLAERLIEGSGHHLGRGYALRRAHLRVTLRRGHARVPESFLRDPDAERLGRERADEMP